MKDSMTEAEALRWIAEIFEQPPGSITASTPRDDIPAWDSLGVLTLMAGLDEKCGLVMTDAELKAMTKVDDILAVLRHHQKLI